MAIGFRELLILLALFAVPCIVIAALIVTAILLMRRSKRSPSSTGQRPAADRLAELDSLRRGGAIDTDEYEKQRALIISSV
jgi:Flp pilus assembly protein protease CpaA